MQRRRDLRPAAGHTEKLDSLGDRLMWRLAYRHFPDGHEALVVNHSVTANSITSVRWYELRNATGQTMASATPIVYQQSTLNNSDGTSRWMGSIAMDHVGDMALGYTGVQLVRIPVGPNDRPTFNRPAERHAGGDRAAHRPRIAAQEPQPLGRLQLDDRRSDRRLHLLVHERGHPGERNVQLEHLDSVVQLQLSAAAAAGQRPARCRER